MDMNKPASSADVDQNIQQQELEKLDVMFKDRYSHSDPEFKLMVDRSYTNPPCNFPWFSRPKRSFDYTRNRGPKRPYEDLDRNLGPKRNYGEPGRHQSSSHR